MDKIKNNLDVSVTYTIYGDFDLRKLQVALFYLGLQKEVGFEAVVVNATDQNINLPLFCKEIKISDSKAKENLGIIRNIALKNCSGKYIYACDADIIFQDKLFLKKLILQEEQLKTPLKKTQLLRLPIEEFEDFFQEIVKGKIPVFNESENSVSLKNNFPFQEKIIDHFKFTERIEGNDKLSLVHAGSVFGKKEMFGSVGGYSEEYKVYGWEDSDLQWKLEEKYGINKISGLKVIHLDHLKPYYDKNIFEKNKKLFFKRVREGVDKAIKKDFDNYQKINLGSIKQIYK